MEWVACRWVIIIFVETEGFSPYRSSTLFGFSASPNMNLVSHKMLKHASNPSRKRFGAFSSPHKKRLTAFYFCGDGGIRTLVQVGFSASSTACRSFGSFRQPDLRMVKTIWRLASFLNHRPKRSDKASSCVLHPALFQRNETGERR